MVDIKKHFHTTGIREVLSSLKTSRIGLSEEEVKKRLTRFGINRIPEERKYSQLRLFLSQFHDSLIYILILAFFVSLIFHNYVDAIFIAIVILINTILGFFQEDKVAKALVLLKKAVPIYVRVMRNGRELMLESTQLVPGDIMILQAGDKVSADGRLIEARELEVNEAALTGESFPVAKTLTELPYTKVIAEQTNMLFAGTLIERGRAVATVTATGDDTELGKIALALKETPETPAPLQIKVGHFTRLLSIAILVFTGILFVIDFLSGKPFTDIFISSLAFAVSAIPAGLPPLITVILVLGMKRLLKHKTLVKRLDVVETLGSTTVICTDKTGTLTSGKMQVSHILTCTKDIKLDDKKSFSDNNFNFHSSESPATALKIALGISDVFIENSSETPQKIITHGRPTDKALVTAAFRFGLEKDVLDKELPTLTDLPFDSRLKFSASLRKEDAKNAILLVMGAPEEIQKKVVSVDLDGRQKYLPSQEFQDVQKKSSILAKKGLRVLACAYRRYDLDQTKRKLISELIQDLTFVGFIALKDCIRPEAKEALLLTKSAGMKTILITGDQINTAKAIAKEIGLSVKEDEIIEGKYLETINETELQQLVKKVLIYFRVSPQHKLLITNALQKNGEVVAMIGDGVNDAPAIKAADIGVAIGSGTDIAKEAADMVLVDDNFHTIVKAVEWGRMIFENLRRTMIYFIADDFSEVFVFLGAMLLGLPLPLLPVQILWIDLIENAFPGVALAFNEESYGVMKDKPRGLKEPIFNRAFKKWLLAVFLVGGLSLFITYYLFLKITGDLVLTRTVIFAQTMVDSVCFMLVVSSLRRPVIRRNLFANRYLLIALLVGTVMITSAVYLPILNKVLSTTALSSTIWWIILGTSAVEVVLLEITKYWFLRKKGA